MSGIKMIHITSFAGLQKVEFDFEKGLNIITGANETGKSTVIEACRAIYKGFDTPYDTNPFLNWHQTPIQIEAFLYGDQSKRVSRNLNKRPKGLIDTNGTIQVIDNQELLIGDQNKSRIDPLIWYINENAMASYMALARSGSWRDLVIGAMLPPSFFKFSEVQSKLKALRKQYYTNHSNSKSMIHGRNKTIQRLKETYRLLKNEESHKAMLVEKQANLMALIADNAKKNQVLLAAKAFYEIYLPELNLHADKVKLQKTCDENQYLLRSEMQLIIAYQVLSQDQKRLQNDLVNLQIQAQGYAATIGAQISEMTSFQRIQNQLKPSGAHHTLVSFLLEKVTIEEAIQLRKNQLSSQFPSGLNETIKLFSEAVEWYQIESKNLQVKSKRRFQAILGMGFSLLGGLGLGGILLLNSLGIFQVSKSIVPFVVGLSLALALLGIITNASHYLEVKRAPKKQQTNQPDASESSKQVLRQSMIGTLAVTEGRPLFEEELSALRHIGEQLKQYFGLVAQYNELYRGYHGLVAPLAQEKDYLSWWGWSKHQLEVEREACQGVFSDTAEKQQNLKRIQLEIASVEVNLSGVLQDLENWSHGAKSIYMTDDIQKIEVLQAEAREGLLRMAVLEEKSRFSVEFLHEMTQTPPAIELETVLQELIANDEEKMQLYHQKSEILIALDQIALETSDDYQESITREIELLKRDQMVHDELLLMELVVQRTERQLIQAHQPAFIAVANQFIQQITGGAILGLSLNEQGDVYGIKAGESILIDLIQLSTGTLAVLIICLKIALLNTVDPACELPFLLDDALSHVDCYRLKQAISILEKISTNRQIILTATDRLQIQELEDVSFNHLTMIS